MGTKQCYRCKRTRKEFVVDLESKRYGMCKICAEVCDQLPKGEHGKNERSCYVCKRNRPIEKFTQRKNGTFFSGCKDCNKFSIGPRSRRKGAIKRRTEAV